MRPITFHAINPANEVIKLHAVDGPGPGGASHHYNIRIPGHEEIIEGGQLAYQAYAASTGWKSAISGAPLPQWNDQAQAVKDAWEAAAEAIAILCARNPSLLFQNGPVKENGEGVNGITHEVLLAILIDRLQGFQSGPYKNRENAVAITKLEEALMWLHKRTLDREARGVEGTHQQ